MREPRIAMRMEKLKIARERISVEYDFVNSTDKDIRTEVAFPIPMYTFEFDDPGGPRGFDDFQVWVNDVPVKCEKAVKASVNGNNVNAELSKLGIDAESFGHFDFIHEPAPRSPEIARLSEVDRKRLAASGVIDDLTGFPLWTVNKTYYWQQIFPAHSAIHVRHQYKPVIGVTPIQLAPQVSVTATAAASRGVSEKWTISKRDGEVLADACITPKLRDKLVSQARLGDGYAEAFWIDYILTTANTWKTPISDFRLTLEKPLGTL